MFELPVDKNNLLNINFIKCIDALASLAETQNVSKTAKDLRTSASTITRLIKKLEFVLKTQLVINRGSRGILLTEHGKLLTELYEQNIKTTIKQILTASNKKNNQIVRIACHQLATIPYVFPAIKEMQNKEPFISVNIDPVDKNIALKQLLEDDIDIFIYPMSDKEIKKIDENKYEIKKCHEYQPTLYLNKKHPLANIEPEKLTLEDFNTANMVPINKNARLSLFKTVVNDITQYGQPTTKIIDLPTIYNGILQNFWCFGGGNEFEIIFKCNELAKKQYKQMKFSYIEYHWYLISNKITSNIQIVRTTSEYLDLQFQKIISPDTKKKE